MSSTYRCLIRVGAMIALVTIAAVRYGENAMAQPNDGKATDGAVSEDIPGQPKAQPEDNPFDPLDAPTVQPRARSDETAPTALQSKSRASSDLANQLYRVTEEAYAASVAEFRKGAITDPEVVYRWSMRLMKTQDAIQAETQPHLRPDTQKAHLRRITELAELVRRQTARNNAGEDRTDSALHQMAVEYYLQEAQSLIANTTAKPTAKPDTVPSLSPDDAVKAAETYLGAVLEGNYDEAAELAVPGSLATSKRLMDTIKGLISNKSISVLAIQTSGRRTTVLMQEAQSPDETSDGRARTQFTVVLEPKDGRWLVTTFSVQQPARSPNRNPLVPSIGPAPGKSAAGIPTDSDPFGAPPSAGPKETKVILLQHAKANDLATTIAALNRGSGSDDFTIAVDPRTNRLIVRGPTERIAEILALIEQLDVPGPERTTAEERPAGQGLVQPPAGNYGGAR